MLEPSFHSGKYYAVWHVGSNKLRLKESLMDPEVIMRSMTNNILCLVLSFLTISAQAEAEKSAGLNPLNAVLTEGKTYNFIAGNNNFYTNATVVRQGDHYTITIPVWVLGASLFGLTTQAEAIKGSTYSHDEMLPEYFKPHVKSFDEHPFLKQKALKFIAEIEKIYSRPDLTLILDPAFLKDETYYFKPLDDSYKNPDYPMPYGYYNQTNMIDIAQKNKRLNSKRFALIIEPFDVGQNISPVGFTLYGDSKPSLIAHEMGHVLGIPNEPYFSKKYPLGGLMTAGTQLNILSEMNHCLVQSSVTDMDFYSILLAVAGTLKEVKVASDVMKQLSDLSIDQVSRLTDDVYTNAQGASWYGMSPKERKDAVLQRLQQTGESVVSHCSQPLD